MPIYRVKPGKHHGTQAQYGSGDLVEYTEDEAAGFLDKLELVVETPAPIIPTPTLEELASEKPAVESKPPVKEMKSTQKDKKPKKVVVEEPKAALAEAEKPSEPKAELSATEPATEA